MSDGQDEDKQYDPSQKKLDDARKKGEVPKSNDLITAASYAGLMIALLATGPTTLFSAGSAMAVLLGQADQISADIFGGRSSSFTGGLMQTLGGAFFVWLALPMAFALLAAVVQRALIFAPTKLAPKLNRISPIKGFGNKFGRSGLFEFFKSFAKLLLYSAILGIFLNVQMPAIMASMSLPPGLIAIEMGRMALRLFGIVIIIAFALGILDYLFQNAEHIRKNRMSRKELTDEQKQAEGDPMLKQKRRQKGYEIAMNQMLADVPDADVVIVNPTHFAVALKWERGTGRAPMCLAKGTDEIAARIRNIANENAVPLHSDPMSARALFATVKVGEHIQPEHYGPVAAAIRFAEDIRKKAKHR